MPVIRNRMPAADVDLRATMASDSLLAGLGRSLLRLDSGLGIFRLVHLHDAYRKAASRRNVRTVLSVGSGGGLHEAVLARLHPDVLVVGVDLREPYANVELPNLRFLQGDVTDPAFAKSLSPADFIFSIECLEHISDDGSVVRAMSGLLNPGGALYVEVPFASESDLADENLIREQLELHEHVRPGYSANGLTRLAQEAGLTVEEVAGAFWFPMQPMVWFALEKFGEDAVLDFWPEFVTLAEGDVRTNIPTFRSQATAIKVFGSKRR